MPGPRIATIGYEGLPPDDFVAILAAAEVQCVVDVRALANSRRPGYAKRALTANLAAAGIFYHHVPALGTPKDGRVAARAGRVGEMRRIFARHLATAPAEAALVDLAERAAGTRCCLLCLEAVASDCHRACIAEALEERFGFVVEHLPK
jgi:uncharacterized protein (DUF488 family)